MGSPAIQYVTCDASRLINYIEKQEEKIAKSTDQSDELAASILELYRLANMLQLAITETATLDNRDIQELDMPNLELSHRALNTCSEITEIVFKINSISSLVESLKSNTDPKMQEEIKLFPLLQERLKATQH